MMRSVGNFPGALSFLQCFDIDRKHIQPTPTVHGIQKSTLSEHYVYSCNFSLQFRNTSFDKLAFDRRERVGRIIRPDLLKTR